MRPARLAPFLMPAAILLLESLTLGQPEVNVGTGFVLLAAFAVAFWGLTSVLQRDQLRAAQRSTARCLRKV
jgi:hypothetical protein